MQDEATQLRNRQAILNANVNRRIDDEDAQTPSVLAVIVRESGDPWPPASPSSYKVKIAQAIGGNAIGSTLTAVAVGNAYLATNLGAGTPPDPNTLDDDHKTLVLVTPASGRNCFYYGAR